MKDRQCFRKCHESCNLFLKSALYHRFLTLVNNLIIVCTQQVTLKQMCYFCDINSWNPFLFKLYLNGGCLLYWENVIGCNHWFLNILNLTLCIERNNSLSQANNQEKLSNRESMMVNRRIVLSLRRWHFGYLGDNEQSTDNKAKQVICFNLFYFILIFLWQ